MSSQFLGVATDENFEGEVLKSDKPVLIDFWAPWCGPCKAIGPIVEEIAAAYQDKIKVMKLNVDESQKAAVTYGVRSIPTLIMFKSGKVSDTLIGLVPKDKLEQCLKEFAICVAIYRSLYEEANLKLLKDVEMTLNEFTWIDDDQIGAVSLKINGQELLNQGSDK